jgi:hypothetical protein
MFKKITIGILLLTVFGAAGAALAYNAANPTAQTETDIPPILAADQAASADHQAAQAPQFQVDGSDVAIAASQAEPWQASGTITAIDDFGFDFAVAGAAPVYIELGPPDYWQSQGVTLQIGQEVTVIGSINADMIHASQVLLGDGQVLAIRTESGQPLWSGGIGNGQAGSHNAGEGPESQVPVDAWITIEGSLLSFQGGNMTMGTLDGDLITFQTGQPRFFASQGVSFQVGDEIVVLGYYDGDQFMAGDITQASTGLRVMLRDPNGRPLWSGPGNSNGQGNGNQGNGSQGGQGNGNQGNGNGHRYGRGGE